MDKQDLIEKWLRDALSAEELEAFNSLDEAPQMREILDQARAFKASGFSEVPSYEVFKARLDRTTANAGRRRWLGTALRIAAVAVIGLFITFYFLSGGTTQITTEAGEMVQVELPDASRVLVNAGSELSYKKEGWDSQRNVSLSGEAYFKVAKGSRFDVVTPDGTISVLGTEFNVKQRDGFFEVRCYEGLVRVNTPDQRVELAAGTYYRMAGDVREEGRHQDLMPSWSEDISSFDRVALKQVADELARQFGLSIRLEEVDQTRLFTGSFNHSDPDQALEALTRPLNLRYDRSGSEVIIKPAEE